MYTYKNPLWDTVSQPLKASGPTASAIAATAAAAVRAAQTQHLVRAKV